MVDDEKVSVDGDDPAGIDYELLRFINVDTESQRRIQGFYLPLFEGCETVVDLGCGTADFVALLAEHGVEAIGVDSDQTAYASARERGIKFGHVTFYHPRLLTFLLEYSGFSQVESGENPIGPPPLLRRPYPLTERLPIPRDSFIWKPISWINHIVKLFICLLILPLAIQLEINFRRQAALVDRLNVPFEC